MDGNQRPKRTALAALEIKLERTIRQRLRIERRQMRRAKINRTRMLIQVGGLADKAGLLSVLGLELGTDLQLGGPDAAVQAAILLGAFAEMADELATPVAADVRARLQGRGIRIFREDAEKRGE